MAEKIRWWCDYCKEYHNFGKILTDEAGRKYCPKWEYKNKEEE